MYAAAMRTLSAFAAGDRFALDQDLRLDARGDIAIETGAEDVRQRVIERLRYWRGEWYLASGEGVPYLQEVFSRPISAELAQTIVSDEIRSVEGVREVSGVRAEIDPETRRLAYAAQVETDFGAVSVTA